MADIRYIGRELWYSDSVTNFPRINADIKIGKICKRLSKLELDVECATLIKRMLFVCNGANDVNNTKATVNIYMAAKSNGEASFINKYKSYYLSSTPDKIFIHRVSPLFNIMQELPRIISEETKILEYRLEIDSDWYRGILEEISIENNELHTIINEKVIDLSSGFHLNKLNNTAIKKLKANVSNYKYYDSKEVYYIALKGVNSNYFYSSNNKKGMTESISSITLFTDLKEANKVARSLYNLDNDLVVKVVTLNIK